MAGSGVSTSAYCPAHIPGPSLDRPLPHWRISYNAQYGTRFEVFGKSSRQLMERRRAGYSVKPLPASASAGARILTTTFSQEAQIRLGSPTSLALASAISAIAR